MPEPIFSSVKLLTVICEADMEDMVIADLMRLGARGYTVSDVRGRGQRGVRDGTWSSSANIRVELLCNEARAKQFASHLQAAYYANYGMVLFIADVAVLRPEKFDEQTEPATTFKENK